MGRQSSHSNGRPTPTLVDRILGRSHPSRIVAAVATDDLPVHGNVMPAHLVTAAASAHPIPVGSIAEQVLKKTTNADYDAAWAADA